MVAVVKPFYPVLNQKIAVLTNFICYVRSSSQKLVVTSTAGAGDNCFGDEVAKNTSACVPTSC